MAWTLWLLSAAILAVGLVCGQEDLELRARQTASSCSSFDYDAVYDLENGQSTTNQFVQVFRPITTQGCSSQGVLKLVLASSAQDPKRRRVQVDMFFKNPTGWVFNLGDSDTNNGWAGDASTQSWDAEVQGTGRQFTGFLSDVGGSGLAFDLNDYFSDRLTLVVGDGHVSWLADNKIFNYYSNPGLFGLNGQLDSTGPVNYDLYLGLNRVIGGSYRAGSGLCKVGIKFLPEI